MAKYNRDTDYLKDLKNKLLKQQFMGHGLVLTKTNYRNIKLLFKNQPAFKEKLPGLFGEIGLDVRQPEPGEYVAYIHCRYFDVTQQCEQDKLFTEKYAMELKNKKAQFGVNCIGWYKTKVFYRIKNRATVIKTVMRCLKIAYNGLENGVEWMNNPGTIAAYQQYKDYQTRIDSMQNKIRELKREIRVAAQAQSKLHKKQREAFARKRAALKDFG